MPQISIRDVYTTKGEKLKLSWIAATDSDRSIDSDKYNQINQGLIGHLNFIHPNYIQVLSAGEIRYLESFDADMQWKMLSPLFAGELACLIVTESQPAPGVLIDMCNANGVPLFATDLKSVPLMWVLRHYLTRELAESVAMHGVFLDVLGMGVLITGDSGVGKSELALELISRGSGLIADDVVEFYRVAPDTLEGRSPPMLRDFLEVRGIGLLDIRTIFGENAIRPRKNLKIIVHLKRWSETELLTSIERLPLGRAKQEVLGVDVSQISLPVAVGRNLAVLVEVAVRNYILLTRGIDSTLEFIERHRLEMEKMRDD